MRVLQGRLVIMFLALISSDGHEQRVAVAPGSKVVHDVGFILVDKDAQIEIDYTSIRLQVVGTDQHRRTRLRIIRVDVDLVSMPSEWRVVDRLNRN